MPQNHGISNLFDKKWFVEEVFKGKPEAIYRYQWVLTKVAVGFQSTCTVLMDITFNIPFSTSSATHICQNYNEDEMKA